MPPTYTHPLPKDAYQTPMHRRQWISLFFDEACQDPSNNEHTGPSSNSSARSNTATATFSNIGKLYKAHPGGRAEGFYRFYYGGGSRGSGGKTPQEQTRAAHAAAGVDPYHISHALYDLSQSLATTETLTERHLALFGSGRGAASAWRLAIILAEQGIPNPRHPGQPFRAGQDFRIRFLGMFDTQTMGAIDTQHSVHALLDPLPPFVESALHLIAAHERRAAYHIQSLRLTADTPLLPQHQERLCPGQHGDVTGSYARGEQGRRNELARIPLNQMLTAAMLQEVPLLSLPQLNARDPALYAEWVIPQELAELQLEYNRRLRPETDLYREWAHHECLYFRWLCLLANGSAGIPGTLQQRNASPTGATGENADQQQLEIARRVLCEEVISARWRRIYAEGGIPDFDPPDSVFCRKPISQLGPEERPYRRLDAEALVVKPLQGFERDMLTWMQIAEPLPVSIQHFFTCYVHDEIAQTVGLGDRYLQRRSVFFRQARPWRG